MRDPSLKPTIDLSPLQGYTPELRDLAAFMPSGLAYYCENNRKPGKKWFPGKFHSLLNDELVHVATGKTDLLIVQVPPRHGKSTLASQYFPAWFLGRWPDQRVILTSYSAELASHFGRKVRDCLTEFGEEVFGNTDCVPRADMAAAKEWMTNADGGMLTAGVGGGITGRGANIAIIDDPVKNDEEARSEVMREKIWEWYLATLSTRIEPGGGTIVIMTRWHMDDLVGRLIKHCEETGEIARLVDFPAIALEHDQLGRKPGEPLFPERYDITALQRIRKRVGTYWWNCTPAETPILMADWTEKPISEVKEGDRIIGFERGNPEARAKLVEATVKRTFQKADMVHRVTMESGRTVRCTKDHRWFTGRGPSEAEPSRKEYDVPRVGRRLMRVLPEHKPPTPEQQRQWDYLAGIMDGEGHVGDARPDGGSRVAVIAQTLGKNRPVADRIQNALDTLGIPYVTRDEERGKRNETCRLFIIHNAREFYINLIRHTDFAKADQARRALWNRPHKFITARDAVTSIEPEQEEMVYALETTTGNYIAWGHASSNSLYQQRPSPAEGSIFKRDWFRYCELVEYPNGVYYYHLHQPGGGFKRAALTQVWTFQTMDVASEEKEQADYTVITTWGVTAERDVLMLDVDREQFETTKHIQMVKDNQLRWKSQRLRFTGVERAVYGKNIIQAMRNNPIPIKELKADRDKVGRAQVISTMYENGQVYHLAPTYPAWRTKLEEFEAELLHFPNGEHDDQVDTASYAGIIMSEMDGRQVRVVGGGSRRTTPHRDLDRFL